MQFGISLLMSQHEAEPAGEIFRQAVEQAQLADALGFHSVWMTEQHFNRWGTCPDPLSFAAHLAGVTRRIRLGTGVVVLPLHNPVVLAERAALVDQLSGGRLDLGIGKGHPRQRYDVFGIQADENEARFVEAHDLLLKAWTEEQFSFHGRFYHADNVRLVPRPVQRPHPPVWVASFGNPASIAFAARHGYPLLHTSAGSALTRNLEMYDADFAGPAPRRSVMRGMYVLADGGQARAEMRAPARWYIDNNPGRPAIIDNYELAIHDVIYTLGIVGSPDECIARLHELRDEHRIDYLICVFGPGGVPHQRILDSMRLVAERVMPALAGPP